MTGGMILWHVLTYGCMTKVLNIDHEKKNSFGDVRIHGLMIGCIMDEHLLGKDMGGGALPLF